MVISIRRKSAKVIKPFPWKAVIKRCFLRPSTTSFLQKSIGAKQSYPFLRAIQIDKSDRQHTYALQMGFIEKLRNKNLSQCMATYWVKTLIHPFLHSYGTPVHAILQKKLCPIRIQNYRGTDQTSKRPDVQNIQRLNSEHHF